MKLRKNCIGKNPTLTKNKILLSSSFFHGPRSMKKRKDFYCLNKPGYQSQNLSYFVKLKITRSQQWRGFQSEIALRDNLLREFSLVFP